MMELIVIVIFGIASGGAVNFLADSLPYRRRKEKPGWRHPLIKITTPLLMVAAYLIMGRNTDAAGGQMLIWLMYMAILVLIAVIDLEHRLIMKVCLAPAALLALGDATLFPNPAPTLASSLIGGAVGFIVFCMVYQGGRLFLRLAGRVRGEKISAVAFGFGDVMLAGLSGLMLGWPDALLMMLTAILLGGLGGVFYAVRHFFASRHYRAFAAMPYAPYIIAATIIVMFFGAELWALPAVPIG